MNVRMLRRKSGDSSHERGDFEERNWCWSVNIGVLRATWDGTHVGNSGHTWGLEWWTCGFTIISRFEHRGTTSTENPSRKVVPHKHMWIHSDRNSPSLHQNIPHFTPALFRGMKHGPGLEHLHCLWMWRSWQFRWVATGPLRQIGAIWWFVNVDLPSTFCVVPFLFWSVMGTQVALGVNDG